MQSDLCTAESHSENIGNNTCNLGNIQQVNAGDTNDRTNQDCMDAYEAIRSILGTYLTAAKRDAGHIQKIGLHFAEVDADMASGM